MIGNAVPPKFSKLIAETVAEIYNNSKNIDIEKVGIFKHATA